MQSPAVYMRPRKASLQKKFENVSEGGLEPPRRCCITDSVMYHHPKIACRRCPARQLAVRVSGSCRSSLPGPGPWESDGPRRGCRLEDDREGRRAASLALVRSTGGCVSDARSDSFGRWPNAFWLSGHVTGESLDRVGGGVTEADMERRRCFEALFREHVAGIAWRNPYTDDSSLSVKDCCDGRKRLSTRKPGGDAESRSPSATSANLWSAS